MSGKLSDKDPTKSVKAYLDDELIKEFLPLDLQQVISMVLLNDGTAVMGSALATAFLIQMAIEDDQLNHLDDKVFDDSEDTLRDLILHSTRHTEALSHLIEFVRRYVFAKANLKRTTYLDNIP
jgi:hypothetical protein